MKAEEIEAELGPLTRDALAWVDRLISGEATAGDAAALSHWRARSDAHEKAFRRAISMRQSLQEAAGRIVTVSGAVPDPVSASSPRVQVLSRRTFLGGALAASGAGIMVISPPAELWPSYAELTADYRTAKGERRQVTLSGGSQLDLNTKTSIAVQESRGAPVIEIIEGEAELVAPDGEVLVVRGGDLTVRAEKARANLRFDARGACVTCLDGRLDVTIPSKDFVLEAGWQLLHKEDGILEWPERIDPAVVSAWQRGLLIFRDEPLDTVVQEINRYRQGRIILVNADIASRRVSGNFRLDSLDDALTQIRQLTGAEASFLPGGVVLLG
ncbi:FecR family protein [Tepidicaulis sp. LMO-SS28]|uniref:FecR family protein n=1 Tax=Tepidicaulis sp. LMO-SS28 TaxID=3447455 RepID=UPI003EDEA3C2